MSHVQNQRGGRTNKNNNQRNQVGAGKQQQQQPQQHIPNQRRAQSQIRLTGLVRAVLSGDTVVLVNLSESNSAPPKELQLSLLGLQAPKIGRGKEAEEAFAWESREYLRKLLIGKSVVYRVEHEYEGTDRGLGEIWLDEQNIRFNIVENGWASVKERKEKKDDQKRDNEIMRREDIEFQELLDLQAKAKEQKKGKFNLAKSTIRKVNSHMYEKNGDPNALYNFFKSRQGKTLQGIVEQVRTGSTLKIYLPSTQDEFLVNLSGVQCPVYNFNDELKCDPFSREAKFFTEHCLLNRDVTVVLESMDTLSNFFGIVLDSQKRNVAFNLLKMGLASFVEWNAPQEHAAQWKEAEKQAQAEKLRMWKSGINKPSSTALANRSSNTSSVGNEFAGQIVEIVNAGNVVVRDSNSSQDVSVTFSSIRVPRAYNKRQQDEETKRLADKEQVVVGAGPTAPKEQKVDAKLLKADDDRIQNAYALEAKEYLRKKLIGKKVRCHFDYTRDSPAGPNLPPRAHYSVYLGKNNVAVDLVRKGFGYVVQHKGDEPRSAEYSQMILAEKAAKSESLGVHAPASRAPIRRGTDLTGENNVHKARTLLAPLHSKGFIPAVVEFPFSGTKFKVNIPSQDNLTIVFAIQGCFSEKTTKIDTKTVKTNPDGSPNFQQLYPVVDEAGNPNPGNAALHYAREHLYQRDVEITIEEVDKYGSFFGRLTINKVDFLTQLVSAALVKLNYSASKHPKYEELTKLEAASKAAKKGVWWNFSQEKEDAEIAAYKSKRSEEQEQIKQQNKKKNTKEVTVTEIMTGSTFFFQLASDENKLLVEDMMADFASRGWDAHAPYSPQKKGEWVAAKFSADNSWYRAEVLRIISSVSGKDGITYEVRYVDYGNTEVLNYLSIRQLTPDFSKDKRPANAQKGKLAYVKAPGLDEEFGEDSAALLKELVWGKTVLANTIRTERVGDSVVHHVLLGVPESEGGEKKEGMPLNGYLVVEGLARVERRRESDGIYKILVDQEAKAKSKRSGIWQYGDVPDSDEDRQVASMLK